MHGTHHILVYATMLTYKAKNKNTATDNKMISQGGGREISTYQHLKTGTEEAMLRITNTPQT